MGLLNNSWKKTRKKVIAGILAAGIAASIVSAKLDKISELTGIGQYEMNKTQAVQLVKANNAIKEAVMDHINKANKLIERKVGVNEENCKEAVRELIAADELMKGMSGDILKNIPREEAKRIKNLIDDLRKRISEAHRETAKAIYYAQ